MTGDGFFETHGDIFHVFSDVIEAGKYVDLRENLRETWIFPQGHSC